MPAAAVSHKAAIAESILPFVAKPSRYLAGEWNAVVKDPATANVRVALAFPDAYEIGMSHMGLKILYQLLNARPEFMAERVYAPWLDAEALLRQQRIPLCSHESALPLESFDIVGFTLQYELSFATILNMLELGGIPLRSSERDEQHPLIVAGGPVAFAPEPLADFMDAFLLGDGEEAALELCEVVREWKRAGTSREELLRAVKGIAGIYVPALHQPGEVVRKRTALKLDVVDYGRFPVPYMEIVHDRANIEVMRGCAQGCRFCQAGYIYRPIREHSASKIRGMVAQALQGTGYEEVSLASLSIADLSCLRGLVPPLMASLVPDKTSLSLPSLRVEALNRNKEIAEEIGKVRKTGFTIAPEAGSARLRKVINKEGFDEDQIFAAVGNAARAGWESVKFYFMIGLPTETQEDLEELIRVARESAQIARRDSARGFGLTVSASSFVPKPHTPFQWFAQESMPVLKEKQAYLKARLREARIDFKWHHVESSFLEAVFTLGGREVGAAIALGQQRGCRFDGWTEQFRFHTWMQALADAGVDPYAIANRARDLDEPLPWDHIDCGVTKQFLKREYKKALQVKGTPDCHVGPCSNCGEVCVPNWPTWAQEVGMLQVAPSAQSQAPSPGDSENRGHGDTENEGTEGPGSGSPTIGLAGKQSIGHDQSTTRPTDRSAPQRQESPGSTRGIPVQKIRFEFQKVGELRYLSHLELMRALQRALRRASLPLAYTQGFNPQPKASVAQALAVGVEGLRELGEVEFTSRVEPDDLLVRWNRQLPPELKILRSWEAPLHGSSLSAGVRGAVYQIRLEPNGWDPTTLASIGTAGACAEFLAQGPITVEVTKKGEKVTLDARPFIQEFTAAPSDDGAGTHVGARTNNGVGNRAGTGGGTPRWDLVLRAGLGGSVKPQAVMRSFLGQRVPPGELNRMVSSLRITRTALALESQG
ncbi:MAG TPA: TIGR03960 family B12-binding radical SAM protein [Candidatus Methylomirabilis sp.]|nr:TIGR03960 family B12-binding radical SAM protein [Candidatus Methylomirabilis sp.]